MTCYIKKTEIEHRKSLFSLPLISPIERLLSQLFVRHALLGRGNFFYQERRGKSNLIKKIQFSRTRPCLINLEANTDKTGLIFLRRFCTLNFGSSFSLRTARLRGENCMAGIGSQIVCNGCRSLLIYARGATSVCCAVCNTITPVPPHGIDMARIMCCGCRTLLMYNQGATSVRCSCCHTINGVRPVNNNMAAAQINCGHCRITLMYPYGAPSVKCAVCHYITNIGPLGPMRPPVPMAAGLNEPRLMPPPSTSAPPSQPQNVTVVVENPMTVDEKGKLVSNVVVGVTTGKK